MSKILILANALNTVLLFRKELIMQLKDYGHSITVVIPPCEEREKAELEQYGCQVVFKNMERRGMNPVRDTKLLTCYLKLIREYKPDLVLTYTIKPNVYGAIAARVRGVPVLANVTGLGSAFQPEAGILRRLVSFLYKVSLKKATRVFFENEGNRDVLVNDHIINAEQAVVMHGAGVNLDSYEFREYPKDTGCINFLFSGRLMRDKGVEELFEAIRRIALEKNDVKFHFIGFCEDGYKEKVDELVQSGLIIFHGFQTDVKKFVEQSHCIVHPSYHEGMSNTLLEAAAMGRPLITTNVHGCMEAVNDGVNGYLCEVKSSDSLYEKLLQFIDLPYEEKRKMGLASRYLMEAEFDKRDVVAKTVEIIHAALEN